MNAGSHKVQPRKWTFLVYLAGDNNLEGFGRKDLGEMKAVGSTDEVAIVAQFDGMSDQVTRRYYLTAAGDLEDDCIAELPEVNTGDPKALSSCIDWAYQSYPAQRYALVLWNHGSGWKDEDIQDVAKRKGVAHKLARSQVRGLASGEPSRALFSTTIEALVDDAAATGRAILFDDSSGDFLDNMEMKSVLRKAVRRMKQPIDLLGFDACLMNMLEVLYQIRGVCDVVVGSQEVEPGDGWPYDTVATRLVEDPDMGPEALGKVIVDAYVDFYSSKHPGLSVTQSAVSLGRVDKLAAKVDVLGKGLKTAVIDPNTLGPVFAALRSAQSFTDRDYLDLTHFCQWLAKTGEAYSPSAQQVIEQWTGEGTPLIAEGHHGPGVKNANGLSIYVPPRVLSPMYGRLDFAKKYRWDEFLDALINP